MQILERTSDKLVSRIQPEVEDSSSVSFPWLVWGLGFGGIPLLIMLMLFAMSGVDTLTCKRVEPTQVNCRSIESSFMGLRKDRDVAIRKVRGTQIDETDDSEGHPYYQVYLLANNGKFLLKNTGLYDASRINNFLRNPEKEKFEFNYDTRLGFLIPGSFLSIFVVFGFGAIYFSISRRVSLFYKAKLIENYTFDKSLGKLTKQKCSVLGTQVKEYPFQEMIAVCIEEKTRYRYTDCKVGLSLSIGKKLWLIPLSGSLHTDTKRELAAILSEFLDLPIR
jgi:hypothetical protein